MSRSRDLANLAGDATGLETLTVSDITDLTATATELNKLDGVTATTTELNYVDGVSSALQTQIDAKAPTASPTFTGTTTVADFVPATPLSNRNIIINGAMNVAQRGSQVTGVTSGAYRTVDRMKLDFVSLGTWTIDQSTDAPTGFSNSLKATCTTADASPAASDKAYFLYGIEAQDLQHLSYGTTSAQSMTLSFYVKSNKTGSTQVNLLQVDNSNKQYSVPYTISSADTWEHKQVTISGDTSGLINNDTGKGLQIEWFFNSGSDSTGGTAGATWQTFDATDRNASNLGVGGATSDYFAITGVQLELGLVATPFEHRSYGEELARCERYFTFLDVNVTSFSHVASGIMGFYNTTTEILARYFFPVEMRSIPTMNYSNLSHFDIEPFDVAPSSIVSGSGSKKALTLRIVDPTARTRGFAGMLTVDTNGGYIHFDSEL